MILIGHDQIGREKIKVGFSICADKSFTVWQDNRLEEFQEYKSLCVKNVCEDVDLPLRCIKIECKKKSDYEADEEKDINSTEDYFSVQIFSHENSPQFSYSNGGLNTAYEVDGNKTFVSEVPYDDKNFNKLKLHKLTFSNKIDKEI